ncbi:MAG: DUF1287 domain-containing protein [Clostridia bacterium]|nr:DUF1287 domain-containing protein [Clostridia bacterium]
MNAEFRPRARRRKPHRLRRLFVLLLAAAILLIIAGPRPGLWARAIYARARFGIDTVRCSVDRDGDGLDDCADLMLAARAYVATKPVYDAEYYVGGYPPTGHGVCADVIWQAFRGAGYDLKAMIDADIAAHPGAYPLPNGTPDPNIDFRRVVNLAVFFERRAIKLTTDTMRVAEWQPGDLVFYTGHVGIVSDRRNDDGRPWVIHHTGHGAFEEDRLDYKAITGHYRWGGE